MNIRILNYKIPVSVFAISVFILACNKTIVDRTTLYQSLAPVNIDINADLWKPVLITDPGVFNMPAPDPLTSPAYLNDLNEIKGSQSNLTNEQKSMIKYWSAGAVLRWNEILRELVAKHNLPPYQSIDGTYPAPSSANPFSYPQFPFSNPPYAAAR